MRVLASQNEYSHVLATREWTYPYSQQVLYVLVTGADPAPELTDAYTRPRICRGVRGYPSPGNFEI